MMIWILLLLAADFHFNVTPTAISITPTATGQLQIYVASATQPILGTQNRNIFTPRFPLTPGVSYRAVFTPAQGPPVTHRFTIARTNTKPAVVEQVFPTTSTLPENQLKFYLHFSAPMSKGEAYRHIQLLDASRQPTQLPFLELDEELWDRDARRLTLFFDPGRIKRGLVPHNEAGAPLIPGQHYTLVIDAAWPDATGQPLSQAFTKHFTVVPADRTAPTLASWKLSQPKPNTREPLTINFPEPLDRALLDRMIRVKNVAGAITVEQHETRWLFTPTQAWRTGRYEIEIDSILEDLAGNKLNRLFDVDVFDKVDKQVVPQLLHLRFTL